MDNEFEFLNEYKKLGEKMREEIIECNLFKIKKPCDISDTGLFLKI